MGLHYFSILLFSFRCIFFLLLVFSSLFSLLCICVCVSVFLMVRRACICPAVAYSLYTIYHTSQIFVQRSSELKIYEE